MHLLCLAGIDDADMIRSFGIDRPGAGHFIPSRGEISADSQMQITGERQHRCGSFAFTERIILQKYDGLDGSFSCKCPILRLQEGRRLILLIHVIRVLEKAECELDPENVCDCPVQRVLADRAALDQAFQLIDKALGGHVHIHACIHRKTRGILPVRGSAVGNQLRDGVGIADGHTLKPPLAAQNCGQQEGIAGTGNAADVIKGRHHCERAGFHCRLIRRQVIFPEPLLREFDAVVIAAALRAAVSGKMFHTGRNRIGRGRILCLVAAHLGLAVKAVHQDILARAFTDAPPARILRDVHHRCKGPLDSVCRRFPGGHPRRAFPQRRFEGAALRQRNRCDRPVSVNDITADQQRNSQPRLLHGDLLNMMYPLRTGDAVKGTDPPCADIVFFQVHLGRFQHFVKISLADLSVHHHVQCFFKAHAESADQRRAALSGLTDFLLQGHARQKVLHALLDLCTLDGIHFKQTHLCPSLIKS